MGPAAREDFTSAEHCSPLDKISSLVLSTQFARASDGVVMTLNSNFPNQFYYTGDTSGFYFPFKSGHSKNEVLVILKPHFFDYIDVANAL